MTLDDLLRLAHSAERAAAFAYQGHAASVRDPAERAHIARIEREEWEHRASIKRLLDRRGLRPSRWLEWKYACIGRVISLSCHVLGRFMPMYFAGRLESGNVNEYPLLIDLTRGPALADELGCILEMARVEKEHEAYFLSSIARHRLMPLFQRMFGWGPARSFNRLVAPGWETGWPDGGADPAAEEQAESRPTGRSRTATWQKVGKVEDRPDMATTTCGMRAPPPHHDAARDHCTASQTGLCRLPTALAAALLLLVCGCTARAPFPAGNLVVENPGDIIKSEETVMAAQLKSDINRFLMARRERVDFGLDGGLIRVHLVRDVVHVEDGGFLSPGTCVRALTATLVIDGQESGPLTVTVSGLEEQTDDHSSPFTTPPHQHLLTGLAREIADRISGARVKPGWHD